MVYLENLRSKQAEFIQHSAHNKKIERASTSQLQSQLSKPQNSTPMLYHENQHLRNNLKLRSKKYLVVYEVV
jgi:hypothetical protein